METAAAILVQVIISRTSGLQQLLVDKANQSPQEAMEFLWPYYEAAAVVSSGRSHKPPKSFLSAQAFRSSARTRPAMSERSPKTTLFRTP